MIMGHLPVETRQHVARSPGVQDQSICTMTRPTGEVSEAAMIASAVDWGLSPVADEFVRLER